MDTPTPTHIPLDRQPMRAMKPRLEAALRGTFDPQALDDYVPATRRTPKDVKPHLFDFMDGMRVVLSRHLASDVGPIVHAKAVWPVDADRPARREAALSLLVQRVGLLLDSLDRYDERPDPLVAEFVGDHPHVIVRFPSAAYADPE